MAVIQHRMICLVLPKILGNVSVKCKNKTNHPISSNSHPSVTVNKATHSLKRGGYTKPTGTSYNLDKV